jgi:DTW domain-containing protein YfiP
MHPMEAKKQRLGTGRMTLATLDNSDIIVEENPDDSQIFKNYLNDPALNCYLLYPAQDAIDLSSSQITELTPVKKQNVFFILDATWPCAKKMMRLSTQLKKMNKVSFNEDYQSEFLIKHQPDHACLSTIESVYHTLNLLHDAKLEDVSLNHFLDPFRALIAFQMKCATDPNIPSNRGRKREKAITKQRVRPKTHRLFFWDVNKSQKGVS